MDPDTQKTQPIETHKDGRLTAAIWENEGEHGKIYNATLSYSYRDREGNWRDTSSIPGNELLKAARLSEMAYASVRRLKEQDRSMYVEQQRATSQGPNARDYPPER
ncbi:MAG: hypothetical protein AAFV59_18510 [Pseudomonadota bacterium]